MSLVCASMLSFAKTYCDARCEGVKRDSGLPSQRFRIEKIRAKVHPRKKAL